MGFRLPEMGDWTMPTATPNTGAFDSAAYLAANPDVAAAGFDAYDHYQRYGQNEGRQGFFIQSPYDALSSSASKNGWSPDVGDWFNGKQQTYNAATDGPVGAPVDRNRFNDFLNAHQINQDERDDYYNRYLGQFQTAQQEQQQYQADPHGYTNQKALDLSDQLFAEFTHNGQGWYAGKREPLEAQLNAIKNVDPNAYYSTMLHLDMQKAGWDAGQGKSNADTNARIQNNIQEALKVGVSPEQINNYVKYDYGVTAEGHAKGIAQSAGQGAFFQGIEKVAPAFAAMLTAGALAPAAGALEAGSLAATAAPEIAGGGFYTGAGFGGEALGTTGAGSIDAYMAGAGLDAGSFGGSAFTVPELANAAYTSPTDYMNQAGLDAGTFNKFTPTNPLTDYMGQAGLDSGTYTGANFQMPTGLSAADALKYANQARQGFGIASTLSKLLGGGATTGGASGGAKTGGTATGTTGGLSPQDLAKYLYSAAPAQAGAVPYQIKMNQNPFTFNVPNQTAASQGMYDVSGLNPMANALRKA